MASGKTIKRPARRSVAVKAPSRSYLALVQRLPLRPIQSDADLDRAIAMVDSLLDRDDLDAGEQDYLDVLSDLVERYEDQTDPPRDVSDSEMLRFLMEQQAVKQVELSRATAIVESTISAVLSGKRELNRAQIGKLASYFHVSPSVFTFDA